MKDRRQYVWHLDYEHLGDKAAVRENGGRSSVSMLPTPARLSGYQINLPIGWHYTLLIRSESLGKPHHCESENISVVGRLRGCIVSEARMMQRATGFPDD